MKKQILLLSAILFLCACTSTPTEVTVDGFTADKQVYHSRDAVKLNVEVNSTTEGGNATVYVHGVNARGRERIKKYKTVMLSEGLNQVGFEARMPSCTGCAGIAPGDYTLTVDVFYGSHNTSRNITVNIQQ